MLSQSVKFIGAGLAEPGVAIAHLLNKRIIVNIDTLVNQKERLFILHSIKMVLLNKNLSSKKNIRK